MYEYRKEADEPANKIRRIDVGVVRHRGQSSPRNQNSPVRFPLRHGHDPAQLVHAQHVSRRGHDLTDPNPEDPNSPVPISQGIRFKPRRARALKLMLMVFVSSSQWKTCHCLSPWSLWELRGSHTRTNGCWSPTLRASQTYLRKLEKCVA